MEAILGRPSGGCIDEKGTLLASAYYSVQLAAGVLCQVSVVSVGQISDYQQ